MSAAKELVQQHVLDYISMLFNIAEQTKFSIGSLLEWPLHIHIAMSLQIRNLLTHDFNFALVVVDGKIDRTLRDKCGEKYSKNPGNWTFHDFLIFRHPTTNNDMIKARESAAKDEFKDISKVVI